ncbi:hypothetical protein [Virgibacillus sp. 6R]|uniref:hypothetical protein n=1 Tax=Metabacillus sp. 22489 TaxID=3453928 RepID=UPI0011A42E5E
MKEQFERSMLDIDLCRLETDIVWKQANSEDLKFKLVRDMKKRHIKSKLYYLSTYFVRISACAVALGIAFILIKQDDFKEHTTSHGSYQSDLSSFDAEDQVVFFTRAEQELTKSVNGVETVILSGEATVPLRIPTIEEKPEIIARKENQHVLVNVNYLLMGGTKLSIRSELNHEGTAREAYEALMRRHFNTGQQLMISDHQAMLVKSEDDGLQQLVIVGDECIYYIEGGQSSDDLIRLAELITFY